MRGSHRLNPSEQPSDSSKTGSSCQVSRRIYAPTILPPSSQRALRRHCYQVLSVVVSIMEDRQGRIYRRERGGRRRRDEKEPFEASLRSRSSSLPFFTPSAFSAVDLSVFVVRSAKLSSIRVIVLATRGYCRASTPAVTRQAA